MATLPNAGTVPLQAITAVEGRPSLTFWVNPATNAISGTADGLMAVKQTVDSILHTQRFYYQIYTPNVGVDYRGLIGEDTGVAASQLKRRLEDAFSVDERILGLENYHCTEEDGCLHASFTVRTVFGDLSNTTEVKVG